MNPQGGDGGIFVPINLDTTNAVEQFDKFKDTVKQADIRPNSDLDSFFDDTAEAAARAAKEVAVFQQRMRDMRRTAENVDAKRMMGSLSSAAKFQMSMASLGRSSYRSFAPMPQTRAFSNEYQRQQSQLDEHKKNAYESRFQNRYLQSEIDDGSYRKVIQQKLQAERVERSLYNTRDKLLRQTRLIERQERYGRLGGQIAHLYGENAAAFQRMGGMAGRGLGYAGAAGLGMVASGFSGTVQGERFGNEVKALNHELAGSFIPLLESITKTTRSFREMLASLGPSGQSFVQDAGLGLAGAGIGYRLGGPWGAAAGGAIGYGYRDARKQRDDMFSWKDSIGSVFGKTSNDFAVKNADLADMSPSQRLAEIEKRKEVERNKWGSMLTNASNNPFGLFKAGLGSGLKTFTGSSFGIGDEALSPGRMRQGATEAQTRLNTLSEIERLTKEGKSVKDFVGAENTANPNRKQVTITEGAGFAGVGDTYRALQEMVLKTAEADSVQQLDKMDVLIKEIQDLNQNVKDLGK